MSRNVIFRADGNNEIGLGHVIRCLALANILTSDFHVSFLIQEPSQSIIDEIEALNLTWIGLKKSDDYLAEAKHITNHICSKDDIIVLDGYNFGTHYQKVIRNKGCKLVCIDDSHDKHFLCDAVINHSEGINPSDYSTESHTKLYLGFKFALLRPPFLKKAKSKADHAKKAHTVLICIGGADPLNLTQKFLKICNSVDLVEKIFVVTGGAYQFSDTLQAFAGPRTEFLNNLSAEEMVSYMGNAFLGILPSSGISIEAIAARLPFATGYFANNQENIYHALIANNLALDLGNLILFDEEAMKLKITNIFHSSENFGQIIRNQQKFIDGESDKRLTEIFKSL